MWFPFHFVYFDVSFLFSLFLFSSGWWQREENPISKQIRHAWSKVRTVKEARWKCFAYPTEWTKRKENRTPKTEWSVPRGRPRIDPMWSRWVGIYSWKIASAHILVSKGKKNKKRGKPKNEKERNNCLTTVLNRLILTNSFNCSFLFFLLRFFPFFVLHFVRKNTQRSLFSLFYFLNVVSVGHGLCPTLTAQM